MSGKSIKHVKREEATKFVEALADLHDNTCIIDTEASQRAL